MRTVTILHRVLCPGRVVVPQEGRHGQIPEALRVELKELARCAVQDMKESRQRGLQVSV